MVVDAPSKVLRPTVTSPLAHRLGLQESSDAYIPAYSKRGPHTTKRVDSRPSLRPCAATMYGGPRRLMPSCVTYPKPFVPERTVSLDTPANADMEYSIPEMPLTATCLAVGPLVVLTSVSGLRKPNTQATGVVLRLTDTT